MSRSSRFQLPPWIVLLLLPLPLHGGEAVWRPLGPAGGTFNNIALAPSDPEILYVSTPVSTIYKTTDGGESWVDVSSDTFKATSAPPIAVDPTNPDIVLAGTLRSADGGGTWIDISDQLAVGPFIFQQERYVFNPQDPNIVYVGQNGPDGVWKSTDGGLSWVRIIIGADAGFTLDIDPQNPDNLYVSTPSDGVYRTTDAGASWQAPNTWPGGIFRSRIAVDPVTPSTVYAAAEDGLGLRRSLNSGIDWHVLSTVPSTLADLAIDPTTPMTLYAPSYGSGLFKSVDGGSNWSPIGTGASLALATAVLIDPSVPSTLYLGLNGREGLVKSVDGGITWSAIHRGVLRGHSIQSIAVDPSDPDRIYAGALDGGVYLSTDRGQTWSLRLSSGGFFFAIAVDPVNPAIAYVANSDRVFKTTNQGADWEQTASLGFLRDLVVAPSDPQSLYASGPSSLWRSTDGGHTWTDASGDLPASNIIDLAVDPTNATTVYGAGSSGIFRTVDGGAHWTSIVNGLPIAETNAIDIDPSAPNILYAASSGRIYKTTSSGTTWSLLPASPSTGPVKKLRVSNTDPSVLYVAADLRVFRSADGGTSWKQLDEGLSTSGDFPLAAQDIAIAPDDPLRAFVGTAGASVFGLEAVAPIFVDGFESGDTSAWTIGVP